jgi:hypothetical protein
METESMREKLGQAGNIERTVREIGPMREKLGRGESTEKTLYCTPKIRDTSDI